MLDVLDRLETELPAMLDDPAWESLNINYHAPHVERLWRPWAQYRVSLHRIHPCAPTEALFHPHPWPSAMRVLSGTYEMAIGYGAGGNHPPIAARLIATGDLRYEMIDPDAWHYVRPIGKLAMSVMVTGRPWRREAPKSNEPLQPLTNACREDILAFFRARYPTSRVRQ